MNAVRKLELVHALSEFSKSGGLTPKGMNALVGCNHHKDERWGKDLFPRFSWLGQKAVQLSLLIHRNGRKSMQGRIAMTELVRIMTYLRPEEIMAMMTGLNEGIIGLRRIQDTVKLFSRK